ncbi:uncharacterized protein PG986_008521 [Apiospora aurea]|uniref:Uncharacterized protein n=1 Tax=Apiospora aurea TaxID=335848 RepID=A0ABR1QFM9_9PEZI
MLGLPPAPPQGPLATAEFEGTNKRYNWSKNGFLRFRKFWPETRPTPPELYPYTAAVVLEDGGKKGIPRIQKEMKQKKRILSRAGFELRAPRRELVLDLALGTPAMKNDPSVNISEFPLTVTDVKGRQWDSNFHVGFPIGSLDQRLNLGQERLIVMGKSDYLLRESRVICSFVVQCLPSAGTWVLSGALTVCK